MYMKKSIFGILGLLAILSIASCKGNERGTTSGSNVDTTQKSSDVTTKEEPVINYGEPTSVSIDANIPSVEIKKTIDISKYVHFKDADGVEIPHDYPENFAVDYIYDKDLTGGFYVDNNNPFLLTATRVGKAKIRVRIILTDTDFIWGDGEIEITANQEVKDLSTKWSKVKDNFTVSMGNNKGIRTANYASSGSKGVVILKDDNAYSFTSSNIDGKDFKVLPGAKNGKGVEALDKEFPALNFSPESFSYDPTIKPSEAFDYYIDKRKDYSAILASLGLSTTLSLDGKTVYVYSLGVKKDDADFKLRLFLFDLSQTVYETNDIVFTDIGTSKLPYVEDYIKAGTIPTSDSTALINKISEVADNHDYTINSVGEFYKTGTNEVASKDSFSTEYLKSFYDYSRKERNVLVNPKGFFMHYYQEGYEGGYEEVATGYFNHNDGTVYTFTMPDGKAKIGSQDYDYVTGQATPAPYWNTYKSNLSSLTKDRLNGANFAFDGTTYSYTFANDANKDSSGYSDDFASNLLQITHPDIVDLITDTSQGSPIINNLTATITLDEKSIDFKVKIPMAIDDKNSVDFVIDTKVTNIGSTVINGLDEILDATPDYGGWEY